MLDTRYGRYSQGNGNSISEVFQGLLVFKIYSFLLLVRETLDKAEIIRLRNHVIGSLHLVFEFL